MRLALVGVLVAAFWTLVGSVPALADSWAPPSKKVYESSNRQFRLTVFPRDLSTQLDYFRDAVDGKPNPGQRPDSAQTRAEGLLERREGKSWTFVWRKPLVNDVAPVEAVVADSGRYVATFDNWHFMGHGENVVVLYGPDGSLIRSLQLSDFLPDFYIKALPHSVSSIWWRDDPSFAADDKLILKVVVPSEEQVDIGSREFVNLTLDPMSGAISPINASAWEEALSAAGQVAAAREEAERRKRAAFVAPLVAPPSTEERDWHQYLTEAFFRIDPDWQEGYPATKILRSPSSPDYKPSVDWLREAMLEKDMPADVIMIASPASPENLLTVLTQIVPKVRPNALRKTRIYVAIPAAYKEQVAGALARTGAEFIHLNPSTPITQRAERLARLEAPLE